MQILSLVAAVAVLAMGADAASGKGKPGYCADSKACAASYSCVSVQTTRAAVTDVKQCLPTTEGALCTGISPGLCPSFSTTWGTSFREISSVCAYISPDAKCVTASSTTNSTKGTVECLSVTSPSDKTETVGVIYGCVDFDGDRLLFEKNSDSDKLASQFNYSAIIDANCVNPKNPSGSNFVCSSQGTCAPKSANSMDYACACNVGFSGTYCEKIQNNKCYNDGVCGGGSCDLTKMECTNCTAGTMGDKCAQCDPTYDATQVCSGHGTCKSSSAASGSSSGSSATAGSTATTTATPATTTAAPASDSSYEGNAGVSAAETSSGSGEGSAVLRFLATTTSTYTCECATGYSDTHCAIKVKTNSSSSSSTTTAPSTSSPAASTTVSIATLAVASAISALYA